MNPIVYEQLGEVLQRDFELLDYPRRQWPVAHQTAQGQQIYDCVIVGGGQGGLAVAWGLLRDKVKNILVIDASPEGAEGPWRTFGRMVTLRTPKYLTGPDGGIPNLTIRAWYEAQHGPGAWEKLELIPKEMWADYLAFFRRVCEIPVRNLTRAGAIEWRADDDCFAIPTFAVTPDEHRDGELDKNDPRDGHPEEGIPSEADRPVQDWIYARTVVLATGIEGSGAWQTPAMISESLPPHLYAHTHTDIDFPNFKGKRIGVLGAGACAFDNSAVMLEHGAQSVDLFFRRKEMVRTNPYRWAEFTGFLKHHADLPDADKWKFILQLVKMGQLPPQNTYKRAVKHSNFTMHAGSPFLKVEAIHTDNPAGQGDPNAVGQAGAGVRVTTPHGSFDFDYLITGTGFRTDLGLRPELPNLVSDIALWGDRFTPPESEKNEDLLRHPYLGQYFEFTPKTGDSGAPLDRIFNYTFGCLLSLGFGGASISGMKYSVPRVVAGVTRQLYLGDKDHFFETLKSFEAPEF